nr:MAG TPA: hypothetical protein [Caudoviricetes sp.]
MKHISFFAIFFDVLFYSDILLFPSQLLQLLEFVTIGVANKPICLLLGTPFCEGRACFLFINY